MTCSRIRQAFLEDQPLPKADVQAHLESCPQCRELYEDDARLGRSLAAQAKLSPQLASSPNRVFSSALDLPEHLFQGIEANVAREIGFRAWLRSRPTRLRFGLVLTSIALVVIVGGGLRLRVDFSDYPRGRLLALLAGYVLAASLAVSLAVRNELSPAPWRRLLSRRPALLLGALALPMLAAFAPATEACRHLGPQGALNCFSYGLLFTGPVALLIWAVDRDDLPSLGTASSSAVALGFASSLLLELHCPNGNVQHLLLGHASLGVAWLVAWLVLRNWSLRRED